MPANITLTRNAWGKKIAQRRKIKGRAKSCSLFQVLIRRHALEKKESVRLFYALPLTRFSSNPSLTGGHLLPAAPVQNARVPRQQRPSEVRRGERREGGGREEEGARRTWWWRRRAEGRGSAGQERRRVGIGIVPAVRRGLLLLRRGRRGRHHLRHLQRQRQREQQDQHLLHRRGRGGGDCICGSLLLLDRGGRGGSSVVVVAAYQHG